VYIKYPPATPPKNGSRPSEGHNSRLKTTTRRSINPLHKFYAVKFSCIHGGRNYKATGKARKTSYVGPLVFPFRGKILKPGFRVAEKRNPGKPRFIRFLK